MTCCCDDTSSTVFGRYFSTQGCVAKSFIFVEKSLQKKKLVSDACCNACQNKLQLFEKLSPSPGLCEIVGGK